MVKKPKKETATDRAVGIVRELFAEHGRRLQTHANLMQSLMALIDPQITDQRFDGWIAAEIDRRNTGKPELHGVPSSIRAAHLDDLNAWISNSFRRRLAAYRAAILTQSDGDKTRDVSTRWPEVKRQTEDSDLW